MAEVKIRYVRNVEGWKRGDEYTVERSPFVEKMISNGYVIVVEDYAKHLDVPKKNDGLATWREFMEWKGYTVHPQMTRRDLIDMWEGRDARG